MDTRSKEKSEFKSAVELHCDSRRCWKCHDDVCEERFDDLVFGVGP
jgi:hypothetical protein